MKNIKSFFKVISLSLLFIVMFFGGMLGAFVYTQYKNINDDISKNYADLGIDKDSLDELKNTGSLNNITNIALFGIDSRSENGDMNKGTRSDSIIILSLDKIHNKIKLSSIMRDTYVNIPGRKNKDKINHAYAYGGPELAIKTLNTNFGLNIQDYATIDFFGLEKIIDAIGGIELDIKSTEINELNKYVNELARIENKKAVLYQKAGVQTVTGMQAVSYSRIRKVGNGDYERTERQRKVIMAILEKVSSLGVSEILNLITTSTSYVKTSINMADATKIVLDLLKNKDNMVIEDDRFPVTGDGKTINGVWYMVTDLYKMKNDIRKFIYEYEF